MFALACQDRLNGEITIAMQRLPDSNWRLGGTPAALTVISLDRLNGPSENPSRRGLAFHLPNPAPKSQEERNV